MSDVSMFSLCQYLKICLLFVHSVTISNESAFYFIEIIGLTSWIGTQTQNHSMAGPMKGLNMSSLCQNHEILYVNFIQLLFAVIQPLISLK